MRPLIMSASRSSWRTPAHHGGASDKNVSEMFEKVRQRDKDTCQYCEFRSPKLQEIDHLDHNHENNALENLVLSCVMCHSVNHIGAPGVGTIVYLPEISQINLHHLSRAIFMAENGSEENNDLAGSAANLWTILYNRRLMVEREFNSNASDPAFLGQVFLMLREADYARRGDFLAGLRLLPSKIRCEEHIKYWRDTVYKDLPSSTWERLIPESLRDISGDDNEEAGTSGGAAETSL